ncbi:MAG TPA: hypothetical protein VF070_15100, partial [Streptosporangiaceae bacterium]
FKIMVPVVILTAGTVLNAKLTGRTMLIIGWMGGFAIQAFIRHAIWDVSLFSALGVMTGVAFLLFTNYMITDPGTTPSKPVPQFIFGGAVAFFYAVLMEANIVFTLFFAVVITCAVRGGGWWTVYLYNKYRTRRYERLEGAAVSEQALRAEPESSPVAAELEPDLAADLEPAAELEPDLAPAAELAQEPAPVSEPAEIPVGSR